MGRTARGGAGTAAGVLAALSGLHLAWAAGSTWPLGDESQLATAVAGTHRVPGRTACLAVGAGLAAAACTIAGLGGTRPAARIARVAVAVGFLIRGAAGLTANTRRLVPWTPTARFVQLDRRYYGPLCLLISAGAAASIPGSAAVRRRPRLGSSREEG